MRRAAGGGGGRPGQTPSAVKWREGGGGEGGAGGGRDAPACPSYQTDVPGFLSTATCQSTRTSSSPVVQPTNFQKSLYRTISLVLSFRSHDALWEPICKTTGQLGFAMRASGCEYSKVSLLSTLAPVQWARVQTVAAAPVG